MKFSVELADVPGSGGSRLIKVVCDDNTSLSVYVPPGKRTEMVGDLANQLLSKVWPKDFPYEPKTNA